MKEEISKLQSRVYELERHKATINEKDNQIELLNTVRRDIEQKCVTLKSQLDEAILLTTDLKLKNQNLNDQIAKNAEIFSKVSINIHLKRKQ